MKLGYVIIYVNNVLKTVDFYEKAFNLTRKMVHESKTYAEMETGQTTLAFASNDLAKSHGFEYHKNTADNIPAGVEVALVADDVKLAYQNACLNGAKEQKAPEVMPWGQTVSYVRDINGCLVEICSPIT